MVSGYSWRSLKNRLKLFSSYSDKSDEALMEMVQRGDHRAFSSIYDRYANRLKRFFYRMLWSDSDLADDKVHDLFEKIIQNPDSYDPSKPFQPWVFRIASNMCKNAYRKRGFEEEYRSQLEEQGIELSRTEAKMDERILRDRIHQLLGHMGEEKRDLFIMRYQQEFSLKELAGIFDTPEGTIKSRLHNIKKELAEAISTELNPVAWKKNFIQD